MAETAWPSGVCAASSPRYLKYLENRSRLFIADGDIIGRIIDASAPDVGARRGRQHVVVGGDVGRHVYFPPHQLYF